MPKRRHLSTEARVQRDQAAARKRREDWQTARLLKEVPSPDEMDAALERISKSQRNVTFELEIQNVWRTVFLTEPLPMFNRIKPLLTIVFFKPVLVVATPYMPEINGWVATTLLSLVNKRATLLFVGDAELARKHMLEALQRGRTIGFRPSNEDARDWLRLCLARAMGMKFREHSMLDPSKIIYTKEA